MSASLVWCVMPASRPGMIDPRWVIPFGETCAAGSGNASIADAGLIRCKPRSIAADRCRRRGYGVTPARDIGEMAARCVPMPRRCRADARLMRHPLPCDHAFARPLTPHVIHPNAALPFVRCRSPWCALVRLQSVAWRVYLENAGLRIYSMNTGNFTNPLAEGISAERLFGTV